MSTKVGNKVAFSMEVMGILMDIVKWVCLFNLFYWMLINKLNSEKLIWKDCWTWVQFSSPPPKNRLYCLKYNLHFLFNKHCFFSMIKNKLHKLKLHDESIIKPHVKTKIKLHVKTKIKLHFKTKIKAILQVPEVLGI